MTLREASKSFGIAEDVLRQYEKNGLLKSTSANGGADNYREEDFEQLGLIKFLLETGFSFKDLKRYLELMRNSKTTNEQIHMLRKRRSELLEGIHEKQQLLDRIDYMIWEKRKETAQ
ncbi:MAG: MerR family transcriptional regulator [Ruminococcus sp.]|nr:MerR family transcriptional regulator [Ruminococcus sp.]MCM1381005.1 MerR family transcriptional regulator [Muribaculaceae bacterium]MCM1479238.1 MerR family transcriptional regulator [Muribaculaceae bacterium]